MTVFEALAKISVRQTFMHKPLLHSFGLDKLEIGAKYI